tara:strand:- start:144 stop:626 length:483 start_codon:yes stop_codon:yes gene_type:complete
MSRAIDLVITYRVVKLLVTPFEKQDAFKYGIIDKDGKVLRKYKTITRPAEKRSYTILHRFVFNLKRLLQKAGLGGRLGTFAVALAVLLREDKSYEKNKALIESAVITYLKETNQYDNLLNEEGDVITFEPEQQPVCNCFGIDVYEVDNKLISENEYAKTL